MDAALAVIAIVAILILIILASAVRVLREYERGVIFRLGRLIAQKGPGLILLIPTRVLVNEPGAPRISS